MCRYGLNSLDPLRNAVRFACSEDFLFVSSNMIVKNLNLLEFRPLQILSGKIIRILTPLTVVI